jgi:hypothetical protein
MTSTNLPKPLRPRYPWRILLLAAVTLPLVAVGGWVGICLIDRLRASWEVQAVVAELDRDDPGWTLEELLAQRPPIPDEQNGALRVAAAYALIPKEAPARSGCGSAASRRGTARKGGPGIQHLQDSIIDLEPCIALDAKQLAYLRSQHKKMAAAFREAIKLTDYPRGRYAIDWLPGPRSATLEPAYAGRAVIDLLADGAQLHCHDKDLRGACRCMRSMLHLANYSDDEPCLSVYLMRAAEKSIAAHTLERILGQGQPPPEELLTLQRLLEAADRDEPASLRKALRGDRALVHREMQGWEEGEIPWLRPCEMPRELSSGERLLEWSLEVPVIRRSQALTLRMMTKWIDQCEEPPPAQAALEAKLSREVPGAFRPLLGHSPMVHYLKTAETSFRIRAYLRCAAVLAAVERYRQEKKEWPASLAALVPNYLAEVPARPV